MYLSLSFRLLWFFPHFCDPKLTFELNWIRISFDSVARFPKTAVEMKFITHGWMVFRWLSFKNLTRLWHEKLMDCNDTSRCGINNSNWLDKLPGRTVDSVSCGMWQGFLGNFSEWRLIDFNYGLVCYNIWFDHLTLALGRFPFPPFWLTWIDVPNSQRLSSG